MSTDPSAVRVVILAGGPGTRLYPLTAERAKATMPLAGRPLLEWIIAGLKKHGLIGDIIVDAGRNAGCIEACVGDGARLSVNVTLSQTLPLLGTAGNIRSLARTAQTTVVVYGDTLTDLDYTGMLELHHERRADVTIAVVPTTIPRDVGVAAVDGSTDRITRFVEKPSQRALRNFPIPRLGSAAIYVVAPHVIDSLPAGRDLDWARDVFPAMISSSGDERIQAYRHSGVYFDVGAPVRFLEAERWLLSGKIEGNAGEVVKCGSGCTIDPNALLSAPVVLGDRVAVGSARIHGSVVGSDSQIGEGARIEEASLWEHCLVEAGAIVTRAIIADGCQIGSEAVISEGAVLGAHCVIHAGSRIPPSTHLRPGTVW